MTGKGRREVRGGRRPMGLLSRTIMFSCLLLVAFIIVAPFAYVFVASLQVTGTSGLSWANWSGLLSTIPMVRDMSNSAILAVGSAGVMVILASMAGFAFAKLRFPGSQALLFYCIGTITVPVIAVIIPEYVNFSKVGLLNTYYGTILVYVAFNLGLCVFFFTSYFRSLPDSLVESALVDGASYVKTYFRIMLPMAVPAVITVGVLMFILVWNDLLVALLFMPGLDTRTIGVALATLTSQHSNNLGAVTAGALVSAVPTVLVYSFFQRYLVTGVTMGAVK
jgi:multiple sugar transport system permease protein